MDEMAVIYTCYHLPNREKKNFERDLGGLTKKLEA